MAITISDDKIFIIDEKGKPLFSGTPEELALQEDGEAIKSFIFAIERLINACKTAQREVKKKCKKK